MDKPEYILGADDLREIYLDNCATTPVDPDVAEAAKEAMLTGYGNPSSLHKKGIEAEGAVSSARAKIAAALGCEAGEVYFTSGGTEADNLAVFGAARAKKRMNVLVSTEWEHSAVLEPLRVLEKEGRAVRLAKPSPDGRLDAEALAGLVDGDTALVSCMMVNSEVGFVADIERLAKLVRRKNPRTLIHCDAVQGFGKLGFSVKRLGVDLLSVSGHKIHAPKGIGALYVSKSARILPLLHGGGQEKALRPGTEAVPLIAAFGVAAENAANNLDANYARVSEIKKRFLEKSALNPRICINSPPDSTPYICNISVTGVRSEILLHSLAAKGIYVSSGSACGKGKQSHVLRAMGLKPERLDSAIRLSFSKYNEAGDADAFFAALESSIGEIRS